ncbi:centrosomal protein of 135 kDa isoform X4 [Hydra vulgaris]|uniref:Centrosomal protein of 135 kDa isoform X4 n=1 Tax=Hydra vulgaris TaxID=6087 RepID=A0ABM4D8W1_HYDVU
MAQQKFVNLRKRLDQFGYRQPLGIESVPLVEKLFSDLIHTTESFKNYKFKKHKQEKNIDSIDHSEPYRVDNAKLMQENNELHLKLLKANSEINNLTTEMKETLKRLENQNEDLMFLNSQYIQTIKNLEKESKHKSDHIEKLLQNSMNAVVETPGGKKTISFRRPRMDIDSTLSISNEISSKKNNEISSDPYVADLLMMADSRNEELTQENLKVQKKNEDLEKRYSSLKNEVELRDQEISRLMKVLEGGRPVEAVLKDHFRSSSDRVVSHLNMQVDYLQQANRDMEKKQQQAEQMYSDVLAENKALKERNEELCSELVVLNKVYKNIEKEKYKGDREVDGQINNLQNESNENLLKNADLNKKIYKLKKEHASLIDENEQLHAIAEQYKIDKDHIAIMLERCEKEKKRLMEKNGKLTMAERELVMDMERLKLTKGIYQKKSPDKVAIMVHNIEDDRDYYKMECQTLQKMLHQYLIKSPLHKDVDRDGCLNDYVKAESKKNKNTHIKKSFSPPTKEVDFQENLCRERDELRRERDELHKTLENFNNNLAKIQSDVRLITTERDNVQFLYEQATSEIQSMRQKINRLKTSALSSEKITAILEKAERERDEALSELRKARNDIQTLRSTIESTQGKQSLERQINENTQTNFEEMLSKTDSENERLKIQLESKENLIERLEAELKSTTKSLQRIKEELSGKEAELAKCKLLYEKSDRSCNELENKLKDKMNELHNYTDESQRLKEKCDLAEDRNGEYKKEVSRLKGVVTRLDKERDLLQQQVDEKAEILDKMNIELQQQQQAHSQLKIAIEGINEKLKYSDQQLMLKDREISKLSKQIRDLEEELAGVSQSRAATIKENKRLHDDLITMTEENQIVHQDLRYTLEEAERLKQEVSEYVMQLSRIQNLLAQKELEKDDLLLQYKTLSNKADILENSVQQSEDSKVKIASSFNNTQQELLYLRDQCAILESDIEHHISTQISYEKQLNHLNESILHTDAQLVACNEEKQRILEELYAVRDLCVKLDHAKDELSKILTKKTKELEKTELLLNEARAEVEVLKRQFVQEKRKIEPLEKIISTNREKMFYEQNSLEEKSQEVDALKDQLKKCEYEKLQKINENNLLHEQLALSQEQIASLRRKLATEKFEREVMQNDLRRQSKSSISNSKESKGVDTDNSEQFIDVSRSSKSPQSLTNASSPDSNFPKSMDKSIQFVDTDKNSLSNITNAPSPNSNFLLYSPLNATPSSQSEKNP